MFMAIIIHNLARAVNSLCRRIGVRQRLRRSGARDKVIYTNLFLPCQYPVSTMERMSRSNQAGSAASPNRTPASRRSGRGLGRSQPRARLEWEFGQDARESLPAPRTGRQNGKSPRPDAVVPPTANPPPVNPRPARALQGDVLPAAPVTRADNRPARRQIT